MSFFSVPRAARKTEAPTGQKTYVDVLYDHATFLRNNGGRLGPGNLAGRTSASSAPAWRAW